MQICRASKITWPDLLTYVVRKLNTMSGEVTNRVGVYTKYTISIISMNNSVSIQAFRTAKMLFCQQYINRGLLESNKRKTKYSCVIKSEHEALSKS